MSRETALTDRNLQEDEMAYKLLLADDSITIQKVVEITLSEEDFAVTAVGDGAAGLETAKKLVPDIILADVFMPGMDGYELCGALKQDPALRHIPVVLLAGTFESFDDVRAAKSGADAHLTKPFESAELISMVKGLVSRAKAAPAEPAAAEPVMEAVPFAEEAPAETDDLWSIVSMASPGQPLAGATETLGEEDLWKRAGVVSEADNSWGDEALPSGGPAGHGPEVETAAPAQPVEEAALFEDASFPEVSLDEGAFDVEGRGPSYGWDAVESLPVEPADVAGPAEIMPFESLEQASAATEFIPAAPPRAPAPREAPAAPPQGVPAEVVREEVVKAVRDALDRKIREALEGISRDMIEQVVWEVVPELAEEILVREIEKLKAGA